jgi:hypothetical protein
MPGSVVNTGMVWNYGDNSMSGELVPAVCD